MPSNLNVLGVRDAEPRGKLMVTGQRSREALTLSDKAAKDRRNQQQQSSVKKRKYRAAELTVEEKESKRRRREERKERKAAEARNLIMVAIDFGTTYSGIAWCSTRKTWNDIVVINHWNGGPCDNTEKVPTRIAYSSENDFHEDKWGYAPKAGSKICQWFKLLLDAKFKRTDFDDARLSMALGSRIMRLPENKSAQRVSSDFLRYLYRHLLQAIELELGPTLVEQTIFRFVITHPATWSNAARQATRQAAEGAGFGSRMGDDIVMIAEPEAAAICAITETNSKFHTEPFQEQNTCTMIVDIGGGTIDGCTYRIVRTQPLRLEEAAVGEGAKAGGTSVDRSLHEFMHHCFGIAFESLPVEKVGAGSKFMEAFEILKRQFTGDFDEYTRYELPLKMCKLDKTDGRVTNHYDFDEDTVMLTGEEMEEFFETMLESTFDLIRNQLQKTKNSNEPAVQKLILCGGMGSSPYVQRKVREFINEELEEDIELVVPTRPWSAICRGAVISALEKHIVAFRSCREHLGFQIHEKWDASRHFESDRYQCPILGPRAKNQMRWHVQKNNKISPNFKCGIDCYVVVHGTNLAKSEYVVYQDLYGSQEDIAPSRIDNPLPESGPIYKVGNIKIDLTKYVKEERNRLMDEGEKVPRRMDIDLTLEMTLGSDKGVLTVTAKKGRKKFGKAQIEFDPDPAFDGTLVSSAA
ncbi:hypothetical protein H2204_002833 [Knufia peltigerae]|uniref:Uncharacterized protein n=1 Tax=Knufia peltigerae TaxID=1002370 RepID=A0AA38YA42_9EURO|nr:hypothetical protein H2204_002833 [Knufia peltigerae]